MNQFYGEQLARCKTAMARLEPGTQEYLNALNALVTIRYEQERHGYPHPDVSEAVEAVEAAAEQAGVRESDIRAAEDYSGGDAKLTPPAEEPTEADHNRTEEDKKDLEDRNEEPVEVDLAREEVVAILSPLAAKGVSIPDVLAEVGYTKLSEVPKEKYAQLIQLAQDTAEGKAE